ncbi:MAG: hypothetical protein AAGC82_17460 [Pseudomonadota bacterium]
MRILVQLYLPVLFPSWRFFAEIGASPRVEYRIANGPWRAAIARPRRLSLIARLGRVFWNPDGNEALFLAACAERYVVEPAPWLVDEIKQRARHRHRLRASPDIRLLFVTPEGQAVAYESPPNGA